MKEYEWLHQQGANVDETLSDRKISAAKPPSASHEQENSLRNDTYLKLPDFIPTCHKHKHSEEPGVRFIYTIIISVLKTETKFLPCCSFSILRILFFLNQ